MELNFLDKIFDGKDSLISKDLYLNFKKYLENSNLERCEMDLLVYSLSSALGLDEVATFFEGSLLNQSLTSNQILEAKEISAFMGMLNTYYKFKNFIENSSDYNVAGLRMNAMAKPSLSKVQFEILAFAHSLINGCEFCVKAHESELKKLGLMADKIHDVVRMTCILKGISCF